jgi:putative glycosyltransferase (TIGR04372 family)
MLYALTYGRLIGAPVTFVRSLSPRVGSTLFEVDTDEVRILRSRTVQLLARTAWAVSERWQRTVTALKLEAVAELHHSLRHSRIPKSVRTEMRLRARAMKKGETRPKGPDALSHPGYNRRRLIATPLRTRLREDAERRATATAAAFGIGPETKLVSLHVRERGFKLGDEMQDKAEALWDDSLRNARVETHVAAIDFLVERGYTVVRVGDPTMTPLPRPGVIDLATAPVRDPLLELYCLFRSSFIICGESGPYSVSFLTNTPLLAVNCTDPIGAFPVRADGIYLLKTVIDRATGQALTGPAVLARERLMSLRDPTRYEYVENTPEQILDAAAEMVELLDRGTPESPSQTWYRELVIAAGRANQDISYVRKHGPDRGDIGSGRLARWQADAWADLD